MAAVLISGCLAYDWLWQVNGAFRTTEGRGAHLEDVAFVATNLVERRGGCAGNIAYALNLLGNRAIPLAVVGADFGRYRRALEDAAVDISRVRRVGEMQTARAAILSDLDGNQITIFHLGAAALSAEYGVGDTSVLALGIVGPSVPAATLRHGRELASAGVPVLAVPGQSVMRFTARQLDELIELADCLILNQAESRVLQDSRGFGPEKLSNHLAACVFTQAEFGSTVFVSGIGLEVPSLAAGPIIDPTGCGDAYVAGVAAGMLGDHDWATSCRLGSVMALLCSGVFGAQDYLTTSEEVGRIFKLHFGYQVKLCY